MSKVLASSPEVPTPSSPADLTWPQIPKLWLTILEYDGGFLGSPLAVMNFLHAVMGRVLTNHLVDPRVITPLRKLFKTKPLDEADRSIPPVLIAPFQAFLDDKEWWDRWGRGLRLETPLTPEQVWEIYLRMWELLGPHLLADPQDPPDDS